MERLQDFDLDHELDRTTSRVFGSNHLDHPAEWFWRVESAYHFTDCGACYADIYYERWALYRHTPRGVWVVPYDVGNARAKYLREQAETLKRLVIHGTNKAWAYPTKAEAWRSFCIRQERRVQHCRNALAAAEATYELTRRLSYKTQ